MSAEFAKGIRWNLGDLYGSTVDTTIEADFKRAEEMAVAFTEKYKPLFENLTQPELFPMKHLLEDYKELAVITTKLAAFAHLSFAEQTNAPGVGAFVQKVSVRLTEIQSHLIFFEVAWNRLAPEIADRIMNQPDAAYARHFLEHMRVYAPHTLHEGEEKIMSIKANTSSRAFSRLFDEIINNIPFYVEENGSRVKKNESQVLSLQYSPDRRLRKIGAESLAEGLKSQTHALTFAFNMILADHRSSMQIRRYKHPMDAMNLSNEITLPEVVGLIGSVNKAYPLAQRYYGFKRKVLGLDRLYEYDRYAPIGTEDGHVDFNTCREIVLNAYYDFSDDAGKIAERFFAERWIDAEVREGKQGGGFCCQTTPDLHPYILVNYTGSQRDVMTVAHELGHGLHQYLAAKRVGILESDAPLTMAETASVFGEMLVFEKLLDREKNPKRRLALICGKIDDNFATVFRQIAMTDFELRVHEAGLKEGELSSERLSDEWIKANAEFYGESVKLTENYRHGWKYIPHFIHTPFYCYAYAFAQLFVLTLYQKFKQDKNAFVPSYLEMLSLGGSKRPAELARTLGLDLDQPDFWTYGIKLLEDLVRQAEESARNR